MNLRIEFGKSRSPYWSQVLRRARSIPTFTDGADGYALEFTEDDFEQFNAFYHHVWHWKGVFYYVDGATFYHFRAWEMLRDAYWEKTGQHKFGKTGDDITNNPAFIDGKVDVKRLLG